MLAKVLFVLVIVIFNLVTGVFYYFFKAPLIEPESEYYKKKDLYFKFIIIIVPICVYYIILASVLIPYIRGTRDFLGVSVILILSYIFTLLYFLFMTMLLDYIEEKGQKNINKLTADFVWDAQDATEYLMDISVYINIICYWVFYKYFSPDYIGIGSCPQVFIFIFLLVNFISIYFYSKYVSSGAFRKSKHRKFFKFYSRFILLFVPVLLFYEYSMPIGIYFLKAGQLYYYYVYKVFIILLIVLYVVTMHLVYDYFTNKHSGDYYKLNKKDKQRFSDMATILMMMSIIFNFMCFVCS